MKYVEPELVRIPSGSVVLGVPDCPVDYSLSHRWTGPHQEEVRAFEIGRYSVTRHEYDLFLRDSGRATPADWDDPALSQVAQPACGVSAEDADAYCAWLRGETGRGYRLPRVTEWEKAARGGLEGRRFPWGDESPRGRCWYGRTAREGPLPVGTFAPNGYGLYDMAGNVWQWMADLYVDVATDQPVNTPTGLAAELNRVLVGGSFMTANDDSLWVAYRHEDPPDLRHRCLGFRVALD